MSVGDFNEPIRESGLEQQVSLAKSKADLHAEIDNIMEGDSVVLLIGARRKNPHSGETGSAVMVRRRNAFHFEAIGMLHEALRIVQNEDLDGHD